MKHCTTMEKVVGLAALILSLILALGTAFVFHACGPKDDGTYMNCHNAQNAVIIIGAVLTVFSALALLIRRKPALIALRALTAVGCVVSALIPQTIIHLCMMNNMRCQAVMKPAVILTSVILLIVSAAGIILAVKRKDEQ